MSGCVVSVHGGGTVTDTGPVDVLFTSFATVPFEPLTVKLLVTLKVPVELPVNDLAELVPAVTADEIDVNVMFSGPESAIETAGCVVEDVTMLLLKSERISPELAA
jgi:hypothetical protein